MEPIPEQSDNEIGFDLASVGSRLGARTVDAMIGAAVTAVIFVIVVTTNDIELDAGADTIDIPGGPALILRWAPIIVWGLYEVMLTHNRGQTLGKMVARIKVIGAAGEERPSWNSAGIRWVVPVVPLTLIPGLVGFLISLGVGIWFLWDRNRQGLHDKAAGTYVVRADPPMRPPA